eukprot:Plantae.Rhodophyta-Hildenbrandia_rubra.ctg19145.p1 GENE.Plantae.Rhodophyta-Hildenbrandia_rubra.ctg19145~~Plantae.Rhodophyta-Hildenbrandia_rubra.ctg19145.p1  ORF type:complete len:630 (+),score=107.02 Plantae.Rhodophyta-Hildenbrandia_rubra.ctg19145:313-2202(+)
MLIDCFRGGRSSKATGAPSIRQGERIRVDIDLGGRQGVGRVDSVVDGGDREDDGDSKREELLGEEDLERTDMMVMTTGQGGIDGEMDGHSREVAGGSGWPMRGLRIFGFGRKKEKREWKNKKRGLKMLAASLREREKEWEFERERRRELDEVDQDDVVERMGNVGVGGDSAKRPRSRSQVARTIEKQTLRGAGRGGFDWIRKREIGGWGAGGVGILNENVDAWAEGKELGNLDNGEYLEMDRSRPLVRSTICIAFSHDERFLASTHGDHTVKIWNYPDMTLFNMLEGHPRTPWTVKFHPYYSHIVASGCLGKTCRIWDIRSGECLFQQGFGASISCLAFHPCGTLLAVTSGRSLELWDYSGPRRSRLLRHGDNPYHMVDFHPSGRFILSGEKNTPQGHPEANDSQFTLRLTMDHFDIQRGIIGFGHPPLIIARAIAYNDAGTHFSPCGTMLVACIPLYNWKLSFQIAVMALPSHPERTGTILSHAPLDANHTIALTNLKFSASSHHLLAGYSFRKSNPLLKELGQQGVPVVDIYRLGKGLRSPARIIRTLHADMEHETGEGDGSAQDEINIAVFSPGMGYSRGLIYGTQKGRIRVYRHRAQAEPTTNWLFDDKKRRLKSRSSFSNVIRS